MKVFFSSFLVYIFSTSVYSLQHFAFKNLSIGIFLFENICLFTQKIARKKTHFKLIFFLPLDTIFTI
jgi:hypothetical protein